VKTNNGNDSAVVFNFPNVGTSTYQAIVNIKRVSGSHDVKQWLVDAKTSTSMTISIAESSGNSQDLEFEIALIN
jgi:hypothetical protein